MSYRNNAGFPVQERANVPFAELFAPVAFVGEAVYTAMGAVVRIVGKAVRAVRARARERAAIAVLSALDDRMLKDIGVDRSGIQYLVRKVAENPGVDYRTMCQ